MARPPAVQEDLHASVAAAAEAYCHALHAADTAALRAIFHEAAHLFASQDGRLVDWPLETFLERVGGRAPGAGEADFEILAVDLAGPEMAHVKLTVAVPPRRYTDYLSFLDIGGEWRVIAKIFRVAEGPAI
jgi:hypothetical protein